MSTGHFLSAFPNCDTGVSRAVEVYEKERESQGRGQDREEAKVKLDSSGWRGNKQN